LKPKEYKSIAEQEEKPVDENGDDKTTDDNVVLSVVQVFDSKTDEEKNEMIIKEQIGGEKWDERM